MYKLILGSFIFGLCFLLFGASMSGSWGKVVGEVGRKELTMPGAVLDWVRSQ